MPAAPERWGSLALASCDRGDRDRPGLGDAVVVVVVVGNLAALLEDQLRDCRR